MYLTQPDQPATSVDSGAASLFAGPGEMRERCRTLDWAATWLGPVGEWSPALRTVAPLVLAHPLPSIALWGRELVQIYNDACRDLLSEEYATGLGRPARECWPEMWDVSDSIVDRIWRGESVTVEGARAPAQTGPSDAARFTLSYSPVHDGSGATGGVLLTIVEMTHRSRVEAVLRDSEERQAFLLKLSDALSSLGDAAEIMEAASRMLGDHLHVDRTMYGEVEGEVGSRVGILRAQHIRRGASLPERVDYDAKSNGWVSEQLRRGQAIVVSDAARDQRLGDDVRMAWLAADTRAMAVVSRLKNGRESVNFGVQHTEPREWTASEVRLIAEVAERTWAAAERARAEAALRASESRFRAVADLVPDLLWQGEPDGSTSWYNARWYAYTGQTHGQAAGWGWADAIHPDDRAQVAANYERAVAAGEPVVQENRIRRYDGTYRWFLARAEPLRGLDGRVERWFGAATDIHAQRMARNEIERAVAERTQERDALRRQLASAEEAERRRLARELHDQLGQHLTALSLGLEDVRRMLRESEMAGRDRDALRVAMRLRTLQELTTTLTTDAHNLAVELRPPELDDVGLASALETYVARWSRQTRIGADLEVSGIDGTAIDSDVGTAIYRIVQEALTNVLRHAAADHVSIIIERGRGRIRLIVEDDGRGFDVESASRQVHAESRLGIAGMRERALVIGGTFSIESEPGSGTTIFVNIPEA